MDFLLMTIGGIGFIFLMTALGSALVFCFKKDFSSKINALFLGLASGIMTAASVWSLLLPALEQAETDWGKYAFIPVVLGFMIGAAILFGLDKLTPYMQKNRNTTAQRLQKTKKLFFAVTLHNIPEGLAVGFAFGAARVMGTASAYIGALGLAFGIGMQNFPEGAAVSLPLRSTLGSKAKAFLYGVFSGIVEPLFAVVGYFLAAYISVLQPWLLALSAGAMLFVVAEDLIPDAKGEGENSSSIGAWGVMLGFALMMILDVAL